MQQVTMVRLLEEKACYMADSIDETLTPADLKEALEMVSESYYQSATQRLIIFHFRHPRSPLRPLRPLSSSIVLDPCYGTVVSNPDLPLEAVVTVTR